MRTAMKCPKCGQDLVATYYRPIKKKTLLSLGVKYCNKCDKFYRIKIEEV